MSDEEFDLNDPKFLGRPRYFSLDSHIKAVESLIKSDEIVMAFKLCDMVPAWHRENYPIELTRIKKILYENLYAPSDYASDIEEASYTKERALEQVENGYVYPRADLLIELVDRLTHKPWVFELSTSHGVMPLALAKAGCKFHFFAKNFNQAALAKVIEWLGPEVWQPRGPGPDQKSIFVNTECLEHAYRQEDIKQEFYKLGIDFDYILLSVPYGTLGHGLPNWQTRRLGHIRTYTQKEFYELATSFFPGYEWKLIVSNSLVLIGSKN